mgnify:CR=1 FL=1
MSQHSARLPYHQLSSKAFMGLVNVSETIKKGPLGTRLAELVFLRVSQINNCAYCLNVHYQAASDVPIDPVKVRLLSAWWETTLFSNAEQAALAYAERLTRACETTAVHPFQEVHDELAKYLGTDEISELIGVVINMNIWTRLKLAEGATPE